MNMVQAMMIGALSAGAGCFAHAAPPNGVTPAGATSITLERGACERRCAVYAVTVNGDGTIRYQRRYFVRIEGPAQGRADPAAVKALFDLVDTTRFNAMRSDYGVHDLDGCGPLRRDAPAVSISVNVGGRVKAVVHQLRCESDETLRLLDLEAAIDRVAGTARWTR